MAHISSPGTTPRTPAENYPPIQPQDQTSQTAGQPGGVKPNPQSNGQVVQEQAGKLATPPVSTKQAEKTQKSGAKPVVESDTYVEAGEQSGAESPFAEPPGLPEGEGKVDNKSDQQTALQAFINGLSDLYNQLVAQNPGADIKQRMEQILANPASSPLMKLLTPEAEKQIITAITSNWAATCQAVEAKFQPPISQAIETVLKVVGNYVANSPLASNPQVAFACVEACADYIIMQCALLNQRENTKYQDVLGTMLQNLKTQDQTVLQKAMGQAVSIMDKVALQGIQQDAAQGSSTCVKILMVVACVIMVVVAVLVSVFTLGTATPLMAAMCYLLIAAAVVMFVVTMVQMMPDILDALGAHGAADAMRNMLAQSWMKYLLLALTIAAAICSLIAGGIGIAGAVAGITAGASAGAAVGAAAGAAAGGGGAAGASAGLSTADIINIINVVGGLASASVQIGASVETYNQSMSQIAADETETMIEQIQVEANKLFQEQKFTKIQEDDVENSLKMAMEFISQLMQNLFAAEDSKEKGEQAVAQILR